MLDNSKQIRRTTRVALHRLSGELKKARQFADKNDWDRVADKLGTLGGLSLEAMQIIQSFIEEERVHNAPAAEDM